MPEPNQENHSTESARATPAFAATWDILRALSRSELLPLPSTTASFVALFRVLDDMVTAHISSQPNLEDIYVGFQVPSHLPLRLLQQEEKSWDTILPGRQSPNTDELTPSPLRTGPFPKTETVVFDTVASRVLDGRCNTAENCLNLKQAAYLLLIAAWLQATLNNSWGFTSTPPPFQVSLLLGGPGTGKTFISNCAIRLIHHLQPESTLRAAYTHRAARLIGGQTLHSCCALPFDSGTGSATAVSLGSQKDALQLLWKHISTFLIDEASMLSNEVISFLDLRCKQIKNVAAILWGGLAVRLSGDFHQLPPVGATSLIRPLPSLPGLEPSTSRQQAMIGADIWRQISTVLILDHSHRCQGPLQDLLQDLASDKGLTQASWQQLQSRLVHAGDQRLLETKFRPKS